MQLVELFKKFAEFNRDNFHFIYSLNCCFLPFLLKKII